MRGWWVSTILTMDHAGVIYSKSQLQVDKKLSKVAAFLAKVKNGEDKTALVNQLVQKNKKDFSLLC